jgi:hypothetical protein
MTNIHYYEIYQNCEDISFIRKKIIKSAMDIGIKPTARLFKTTPKTVKKWLNRFKENKNIDFKDNNKKPTNCPKEMEQFYQFKIIDFCNKIKQNNKRVNAKKIKEVCDIPYSIPPIIKVLKKNGFKKINKMKKERKKDLREYKKKYKAFEKIQIDIKYLDDIPELYREYIEYKLPKYQYTARCVRTGAMFISYANEKSVSNSITFLTKILEHLKRYNIDLEGFRIQTDNGKEFTNGFNQRESDFTKIIEGVCKMIHRLIPPGAKTWQSDVETSHRLIEDEFYSYETFVSKSNFFDKAYNYVKHFNCSRVNKYKKGSPKQILNEIAPKINYNVLIFKPLYLDYEMDIYKKYLKKLSA